MTDQQTILRLLDIADSLTQTIKRLLEEKEELRKDAERMDWLESSNESHGFCSSGNGEYRYYALQTQGYKTVRQVIDEAMKQED